jgi:hypothetical protein
MPNNKETQLGLNGKKAKKSKEITIKLHTDHLKLAGYILLVVALITIIVLQHYEVIPTRGAVGSATDILDNKEAEENSTPEVKTVEQEEEPEPEPTPEPEPEEEEEEQVLPITGEVIFTIDSIKIDPKANIEDYAKIESVTFTIKNQDRDFDPKIVAYLEQYGEDDSKTIILEELEAGYSLTKTEKKLVFGYNNIDEKQTLVIKLYRGSKLLAEKTKSFLTSE